MKRLIGFAFPRSRKYAASLFVSVVQGLSAVALLATSAWLISRAAQQPPIMYLSIAIVGVRTFALARASLRYAERWMSHDAVLRESGQKRAAIYSKLIDFAPAGLGQQSIADLSSRVVADVDETQNLGLRIVSPLVQSFVVSAISTIVFWFMLPSAALMMAGLLALAFVLALPVSAAIAKRADRETAGLRATLSVQTTHLISNRDVLIAYGWHGSVISEIEKTQRRISVAARNQALSLGVSQAVFSFGAMASAVIAASIGADYLIANNQDPVMLAVFALLPLAVFDVDSVSQPVVGSWRRYRASAERLLEIEDRALPKELKFEQGTELSNIRTVELSKVAIGYPGADNVLEHFDLKIKLGESIALVGPSGVGKSTVALALARLLNIRAGKYFINSRPAGLFNPQSIRSHIGYLEQNAMVFAATVRTNLKIANQGATDLELQQALERVGLWSMFSNREGLDTWVGERGVLISGGESQRLALARALVADFDLIILDEPTANVDQQQGERLVRDLLAAAGKTKMVLLITHDAKLAKMANRTLTL